MGMPMLHEHVHHLNGAGQGADLVPPLGLEPERNWDCAKVFLKHCSLRWPRSHSVKWTIEGINLVKSLLGNKVNHG